MTECAFCLIAAGERECHRLYEDDETVAFLDENPALPGHALVIPRDHHEELLVAEPAVLAAVARTARTVAVAMRRSLDAEGFSIFHTSGPLVGTIDHAHLHLLPRRADDDIHLSLARHPYEADEAGRIAARIRDGF